MIVGFDPSLTSSGICIDGQDPILIKTAPGVESSNPRIDLLCRVQYIIDTLEEHMGEEHKKQLVYTNIYIESPMLNAQSTGAVGHLFEMGWLWNELYRRDIGVCVYEVTPSTLKKFATGKGNTPKQKMPLICYKKWGVEFDNDPGLDKLHAYALYRYGLAVVRGEYEHVVQKRRGAA